MTEEVTGVGAQTGGWETEWENHTYGTPCRWSGTYTDWQYSGSRCTPPNEDQCRESVGFSEAGLPLYIEGSAAFRDGWPNPGGGAKTLFCTYDLNRIDTIQQRDNWLQNFQADGDDAYLVMRAVCGEVDPGQDKTRIYTEPTCQLWYSSLSDIKKDDVGNYICNRNPQPNLEECRCLNRENDSTYQVIQGGQWGSDACWWEPCRNPDRYHVPSTLQEIEECPNACRSIIQVVNDIGGSVVIDNLTQDVKCDFNEQNTYMCISGDCRRTECEVGDDGCYTTSNCDGKCEARQGWYCDRNGLCQEAICSGDNCYTSLRECQDVCHQTSGGLDTTTVLILSVVGGIMALVGVVYIIYRIVIKKKQA